MSTYNVKERAKIIEETLDKLVPQPFKMWFGTFKTEDEKFFLLCKLIMSTSTKWPNPVRAYENFRKVIKKPENIITIRPSLIEKSIGNLNYYKNKTRHIIGLAKQYIYDLKKKLPIKYEELLKLYGVGSKIISIYLNLTQGMNLFVVDVNCRRLTIMYFPNEISLNTSTHNIMVFGNKIFKNPRKVSYQLILYARTCCTRWLCKKESPCPLCKRFGIFYKSIH